MRISLISSKLRENSPVLREIIAIRDAIDNVNERLVDFLDLINPSGEKYPWTDGDARRAIPYSCAELHIILGVVERQLENVIETLGTEITLIEGGGRIALDDLKKIDEAYSALLRGEIDDDDKEEGDDDGNGASVTVDDDDAIELDAEIIED